MQQRPSLVPLLFLNRDDYLRMRHEYYTLRGWRPEAGLPKSRDVEPAGFG